MDTVGRIRLPEQLWISKGRVDIAEDGRVDLPVRAVNAVVQLLLGEPREETLHLSKPEGAVGVKWKYHQGWSAKLLSMAGALRAMRLSAAR